MSELNNELNTNTIVEKIVEHTSNGGLTWRDAGFAAGGAGIGIGGYFGFKWLKKKLDERKERKEAEKKKKEEDKKTEEKK